MVSGYSEKKRKNHSVIFISYKNSKEKVNYFFSLSSITSDIN